MTDTVTSPRGRPTGRRVGDSGTREAILDAARELFAEHGFEQASIRAIAARAGVDPALIRHFFTDKQTLFAQTMASRTVIPERLAAALNGDPAGLGERLTDTYLRLWEDEATRPVLVALARSAMTTPQAQQMLAEALAARVRPEAPLPDLANPDDSRTRGYAVAAAHLFGIAIARSVMRVPALADIPQTELVALVAPHIQQYLDSGGRG